MDNKPTINELQLFLSEVATMYDDADLRKKDGLSKYSTITLSDGRIFKAGYWFSDNTLNIRIVDKGDM